MWLGWTVAVLAALSALEGQAEAQAFRIKDINPGSGTSLPFDFARLGSGTLFVASPTYPQGFSQLWKSDGTAAGTLLVKDFGSSSSGQPHMLTESGGLVFFRTTTSTSGVLPLWRSDGTTAGTFPVTQGDFAAERAVQELVDVEGTLFIVTDTRTGYELLKSDGTVVGTTVLVRPSQPIRSMVGVNGTLFFTTGSDTGDSTLWTSAGNSASTRQVLQLPGRAGDLVSFQGQLFLFVGSNLWKSDGTAAGTVLVKSVGGTWLTPVGGTLFFAGGPSSDREIWKSDGTAAGTVLAKDIVPGGSADPEHLIDVRGMLLFTAQTSASGRELWKSDGTAAGTVLVKDIKPGFQSGAIEPLLAVGAVAYFKGDDGAHGAELWKSDGTEAGTVMIQDIVPGAGSGFSELGEAAGTFLFFTASDGSTGDEPWALPIPPTPSLSITDVSVTEGNSGTAGVVLTVTLSVASSQTVTVDFVTADGTAAAGSDYAAASGTLTFAPGVTSKTVNVPVNGDTSIELDEYFFVLLRQASNALIVDGRGEVRITIDDLPALRVDDVTVTEGSPAVFTVSLSAPAPFTVSVHYSSADGTATGASDYVAVNGDLTFAPGVTTQTVSVALIGDGDVEADETFFLNLTGPLNATLADGQGLGTIGNNDYPTISIQDVTVTEGNSGNTEALFAVTLSGAAPFAVSVGYATENGTATSGSDYLGTTGRVTFAPGVTIQNVVVSVIGDTAVEPDETFSVRLSSPMSATITDGLGAGTIRNDDSPRISINDVTVTEGHSGTIQAGFTVTLSTPALSTVSVGYATENGSASAGSDYTAASGTITFPAGSTTRSLSVTVHGDRESEPDESFFLNLTSPVNATIEDGQGRGLIRNDDFQSPGSFFTVTPCRALDTRNPDGVYGGPALLAGDDRVIPLVGRCEIPDSAKAVSVNITITQPTASGNLRLYPAGAPLPVVSAINYAAGQTRANNAILTLSASGELAVRCAQAVGTTHFILDVNGYFE